MTVMLGARYAGRIRPWTLAGPPESGTAGTLYDVAEPGDLLFDTTNGVAYFNEGTKASPYWTPVSFAQRNLFGAFTDFRDGAGKAIADTAATATIPGSGLRVFGDGVAETDSGLVAQAAAEGGIVGRMLTTNEVGHLLALGLDGGVMQPDQHGQLVIDIEWTQVSAITDRAIFVGFVGAAADALVEAVTGATTVATLVQDDLAGLHMDSGYTDADRLYGVHNKSDAAASMTAGDTSTDLAAAGTYQRMRVEINAAGDMKAFVDKALVYSQAAALDADEEVSPVAYLAANATAVKSADVRHIAMWANR